MVLQVLAFKLLLKGLKREKSEDLAPASALKRMPSQPAKSAPTAITNLLMPWDFKAVMYNRVHTSRSSTVRSSALLTIERTQHYARVYCL